MKLSEKILMLRKQTGMSQESLAESLNVSRQAISRWEMGTAKPDANNVLQISKLFGVTTDYLLNDDYESDSDLPQIKEMKEDNKILHTNLTLIAIIAQTAFLNVAMQPFQDIKEPIVKAVELFLKFVPLLAASIWMSQNLRYEKNKMQYKKNARTECVYCMIQTAVALIGHYSKQYLIGTLLLMAVALIYIFVINPKYMNRQLTKKK